MTNTLPELINKPYGGARCVYDKEVINFMEKNIIAFPTVDVPTFLKDYFDWAFKNQNISGYERFSYLTYSNGTTETLDKFYLKHSARRLRLWRAEYFYNLIQAREHFKNNFAWVDEEPIAPSDFLVVSVPFSDTGDIPENFDYIMSQCEKLSVPVLIDLAYISMTQNFNLNLNYSCIETVTTSLSKCFPLELMRVGMRMNQYPGDDTLDAYTHRQRPYLNSVSIDLSHKLIRTFSNQFLYNRYKSKQLELCNLLDLSPSSCYIFGIDHKNKYPEYNRGGSTNRLCFWKQFSNITTE